MSESDKGEVVICRACISECLDYKSLYKQGLILGEITTLATLLSFCTSMDCEAEDALPAHLCMRCVQQLARSYVFKKTVLEANELLHKQHVEYYDSNNAELIVDGEEPQQKTEQEHQQQQPHEPLGDDVDAEEDLQELANAAQLHRAMESVEYVTLTYLSADSTSEETITLEAVDDDLAKSDAAVVVPEDDDDDGGGGGNEEVTLPDMPESSEVYSTDADEHEHSYLTAMEAEADLDVVVTPANSKTNVGVQIYETVAWHDADGDDETHAHSVEERAMRLMHTMAKRKLIKRAATSPSETMPKQQQLQEEEDEHEATQFPPPAPKTKVPRMRHKSNDAKPINRDLKCKVCQKQLSNSNSYKYHMQLHSEHTPYLCSLCGESFKTRNAYEGHIVIHDPNNPNTCEVCGKAYRQASSLRTHMLSHSGEKPYRCEICGKGMTQKSGYKKHLLTHTGEMPHTCDLCGRAFRYSSNLLAHKRWHSGEKPYQCDHCSRCFPTAEQRKRHCLVHSGERPFACAVCHKAFKRRSALAAHRQVHEQQQQPPPPTTTRTASGEKGDSQYISSGTNGKQTDAVLMTDVGAALVIEQKVCKSNVVELC